MFLTATQQPHAFVDRHSTSVLPHPLAQQQLHQHQRQRHQQQPSPPTLSPTQLPGKQSAGATICSPPLSSSGTGSGTAPMERGAPEYTQTGLPSPYPSNFGDTQSEASSADHPAAAPYTTQQEVRSTTNYSASATPTTSEYLYPPSARSSSFPDTQGIQRSYHSASNHSGSSGGMAQTPTNPSIAAPSPTYATHSQYPYTATHSDIPQHYHQHPGNAGLYQQPRPDWSGYSQATGAAIPANHHVFPQTPTTTTQPRNQVYSFVPIPGAQQHKRPRRRYEEIERMYKCGWNGCEKAYGTLNHLNAHVTMQAHGTKRTPEEFKEIRKEWKARKKEEEAARKAEMAANAAQNAASDPQSATDSTQPATSYATTRSVQLPPIAYQNQQYPAPPSATLQQPLPEYGTGHVYSTYASPASPYPQSGQQIYSQHNGGQSNH